MKSNETNLTNEKIDICGKALTKSQFEDLCNEVAKEIIEKICWDLGDSELIYSLQPEKISSLLKQKFFNQS